MNKNLQIAKYITADYITAAIAWALFFLYRKYYVDPGLLKKPRQYYEIATFITEYLDCRFCG